MDIRDLGTRIKSRFSRPQFAEFSASLPEVSVFESERRRNPRAEVETLLTAITKDGQRFSGYCRDISRNGTSAIIWGELAVGEELSIAFRTPDNKEVIMIPAVVRSMIANRYGFEFRVTNSMDLESLLVKTCRAFTSYS
jgi:hypothetical protein